MRLDFENITGSSKWFDSHLFAPYYRDLSAVRQRGWLRLGSPLIGLGDAFISSAQATAGLGEALLKGSVNTARGIANSDGRVLKKGVLQITLGGGSIALLSLPIILFRTVRITVQMATDPSSALDYLQQKLPPAQGLVAGLT